MFCVLQSTDVPVVKKDFVMTVSILESFNGLDHCWVVVTIFNPQSRNFRANRKFRSLRLGTVRLRLVGTVRRRRLGRALASSFARCRLGLGTVTVLRRRLGLPLGATCVTLGPMS